MISASYDVVRKAVFSAYKLGYKDGQLNAAEQVSRLQGTTRRRPGAGSTEDGGSGGGGDRQGAAAPVHPEDHSP